MDSNLRMTLIQTIGLVAAAFVGSATTIWVSNNDLRSKTREAERLNLEAADNLKQTAGLRRYVYDNGDLSSSELTGGKMVVRINGSTTKDPVFVKLDMARFIDLCGDDDGCQLVMGATGFMITGANSTFNGQRINAPLIGGSCRFFYDRKSKDWSISQSCVVISMIMKSAGSSGGWVYDRPYAQYEYSSVFGRDDSVRGKADTYGSTQIVFSFKGACYLAEAAPDISGGKGQFHKDDPRDLLTGAGLFLIASTPSWDYPGVYPSGTRGEAPWPATDANRKCLLIIED